MKNKNLVVIWAIIFFCMNLSAIAQSGSEAIKAKQNAPKMLQNSDVIRMVKASFNEDVIINAINTSETNFDVTLNGLFELKGAGVSQKIIAIMQGTESHTGKDEQSSPENKALTDTKNSAQENVKESDLDDVFLIQGSKTQQMKKAIPDSGGGESLKGAIPIAGMFLGKSKTYLFFRPDRASLRLQDTSPKFRMTIPADINPSYVVMVLKLQIRVKKNNRRIRTGKSQGLSYSSGFQKDSVVRVSITSIKNTVVGDKKHTEYEVTLIEPLEAGEYALRVGDNFYDFGVEK